jgi:uncharacterized protein (TIGR03437 family)
MTHTSGSRAGSPAVFHADFSPVTPARPARAGETLIVMATGLGPTRPGMNPGTPFPENPLLEMKFPSGDDGQRETR